MRLHGKWLSGMLWRVAPWSLSSGVSSWQYRSSSGDLPTQQICDGLMWEEVL